MQRNQMKKNTRKNRRHTEKKSSIHRQLRIPGKKETKTGWQIYLDFSSFFRVYHCIDVRKIRAKTLKIALTSLRRRIVHIYTIPYMYFMLCVLVTYTRSDIIATLLENNEENNSSQGRYGIYDRKMDGFRIQRTTGSSVKATTILRLFCCADTVSN